MSNSTASTTAIQRLETLLDATYSMEDFIQGFPLVQVCDQLTQFLSLISPPSVDLTSYTSIDAQESTDFSSRIFQGFWDGVQHAKARAGELAMQTSNKQSIISVLDKITPQDITNVQRGSVDALSVLLGHMFEIWNIIHVIEQPSLAYESQDVDIISDDYIPSESSFLAMVAWLLVETHSRLTNASKQGKAMRSELEVLINSFDEQVAVPQEVVRVLCGGRLYALMCRFLIDTAPVCTFKSIHVSPAKALETGFLDVLVQNGSLNFKASMLESVKDMINESAPFYESIHNNIITALLSIMSNRVSVELVVDHLQVNFTSFDSAEMYPYDLEDAMLQWLNLCRSEASLDKHITSRVKGNLPADDLDDLCKSADQGWILCLLLVKYFPHVAEKNENILMNNRGANMLLLKTWLGRLDPPMWNEWVPADSQESKKIKGMSSGNMMPLYMAFLCQLIQLCGKSHAQLNSGSFLVKELTDDEKNADKNIMTPQPKMIVNSTTEANVRDILQPSRSQGCIKPISEDHAPIDIIPIQSFDANTHSIIPQIKALSASKTAPTTMSQIFTDIYVKEEPAVIHIPKPLDAHKYIVIPQIAPSLVVQQAYIKPPPPNLHNIPDLPAAKSPMQPVDSAVDVFADKLDTTIAENPSEKSNVIFTNSALKMALFEDEDSEMQHEDKNSSFDCDEESASSESVLQQTAAADLNDCDFEGGFVEGIHVDAIQRREEVDEVDANMRSGYLNVDNDVQNDNNPNFQQNERMFDSESSCSENDAAPNYLSRLQTAVYSYSDSEQEISDLAEIVAELGDISLLIQGNEPTIPIQPIEPSTVIPMQFDDDKNKERMQSEGNVVNINSTFAPPQGPAMRSSRSSDIWKQTEIQQSRPSTGLQSYPIPEDYSFDAPQSKKEEEDRLNMLAAEESWERVKRNNLAAERKVKSIKKMTIKKSQVISS